MESRWEVLIEEVRRWPDEPDEEVSAQNYDAGADYSGRRNKPRRPLLPEYDPESLSAKPVAVAGIVGSLIFSPECLPNWRRMRQRGACQRRRRY